MTGDITIRLVKKEDTPQILKIYEPEVFSGTASFEVELPPKKVMWSRIKSVLSDAPWLVAEHEGQVIGYCYSSVFNGRFGYRFTRSVSIYVDPDYQELKVGFMLYSKLLEILEAQGFKKLIALIVCPNPRSVQFHKKFGFVKAGKFHRIGYKFGEWLDIEFYEMTLNEEVPNEIVSYRPFL